MTNPFIENVITQLVNRLIDGDVNAFEKIYRGYFSKVLSFVYRFSLSREDTEEVVQDVFLKLWEKRNSVNREKNLDTFLYVIAKNLVIDRIRTLVASRKRLQQLRISQENDIPQNATEQLVNFYELKEIIEQLIDELPTRRRMIFKMNREKGLYYKEIADLLNISQGTVEKQMSQAIHTLKTSLALKYHIHIDLIILIFLNFLLIFYLEWG